MNLLLQVMLSEQLAQLYEEMERAYEQIASQLQFSCDGCPDNCCDSYFLHHTYIEWAYLWQGMSRLSREKQKEIMARAAAYEQECEAALMRGVRPRVMCPLNESGRCSMYLYRLMVCRTHGVPARMTRPDGRELTFPGCFRCQEIVVLSWSDRVSVPVMERTGLLMRLVALEQRFLQGRRHLVPKVKMTIAHMLLSGPPSLPSCSDR